ncbi:MAG: gamma-glutamylcyclotransferase [Proteobacteria bacterium]|nr:gamma-glutamylcyclotransferase [Pseudomonadota bacterium]
MKCDRCGKSTNTFRMSWFNTDNLCPKCVEKEKNHPMYAKAKEVEHNEVLAKNYNFPGIGKPDDL